GGEGGGWREGAVGRPGLGRRGRPAPALQRGHRAPPDPDRGPATGRYRRAARAAQRRRELPSEPDAARTRQARELSRSARDPVPAPELAVPTPSGPPHRSV